MRSGIKPAGKLFISTIWQVGPDSGPTKPYWSLDRLRGECRPMKSLEWLLPELFELDELCDDDEPPRQWPRSEPLEPDVVVAPELRLRPRLNPLQFSCCGEIVAADADDPEFERKRANLSRQYCRSASVI